MKYCFIINPRAGKGTFVEQLCQEISLACNHAGVSYDIFTSKTIGDTHGYVKEIVESTDDTVTFFSCGGDGTLCETILSVMSLDAETRKRACVGVVPKGTGNDFVSNFDRKELFCNIAAQIEGTMHDIDLLQCNDRYSVTMINIGFDCHVVCKTEQIGKKKWVPRKLAYIIAVLLTLGKRPTISLKRIFDGKKAEEKKLLLTTYANGAFCGGGFHSNPFASLVDGNIDCLEVDVLSRAKFVSMVGDYRAGKHLGGKYDDVMHPSKCKTADVYFDEETPVSVDGEIIRTRELHISVLNKALTILVPRGAKFAVPAK